MRNVAQLSENDRRELFRNTADKMGLLGAGEIDHLQTIQNNQFGTK